MEIITPKLPRGLKTAAVYKITFDGSWFYIGSSKKLKSRFARWRSCFNGAVYLKSINIRSILPETKKIEISIIEWVHDVDTLMDRETAHIGLLWDSPLILNRCPDAKSPKGMRPYFGYVKPIRNRRSTNIINLERMKVKPVAVFDKQDKFIEIVASRSELTRRYKLKSYSINGILSGKRGQPRKVTLKSIGDSGEYITPPKYHCNKKRPDQSHKMKAVNQIDMNGNIVATHRHYKEAAIKIGCCSKLIHDILKGKGRSKRAKGFYVRYAFPSL